MAHDAPASFAELRDERLSAYLDGELPDGERVDVEIEIADDAAMRADLEGLRQVRDGLRELEIVPAPRSFALTAPPARPATWFGMPRLDLAMRTGAAVAAFAFAIVLVGDIGVTSSGADRDGVPALTAETRPFSTESSTAGGTGEVEAAPRVPEPQPDLAASQAAAGDTDGGGASSPAATPGAPVGEATASRLATDDGSGAGADASADAGVKPATASDAPTEQATPPDAGGQVAPSGGTTTLAAPNTGSTEAGAGDADPVPGDTSTDRTLATPPPPATGVEPAATSGDDGATVPSAADDATTSAATAEEPAASPQPALASPVVQPESGGPSAAASDGGASVAAIALGALAVLFTATSLVRWRRRSTLR